MQAIEPFLSFGYTVSSQATSTRSQHSCLLLKKHCLRYSIEFSIQHDPGLDKFSIFYNLRSAQKIIPEFHVDDITAISYEEHIFSLLRSFEWLHYFNVNWSRTNGAVKIEIEDNFRISMEWMCSIFDDFGFKLQAYGDIIWLELENLNRNYSFEISGFGMSDLDSFENKVECWKTIVNIIQNKI